MSRRRSLLPAQGAYLPRQHRVDHSGSMGAYLPRQHRVDHSCSTGREESQACQASGSPSMQSPSRLAKIAQPNRGTPVTMSPVPILSLQTMTMNRPAKEAPSAAKGGGHSLGVHTVPLERLRTRTTKEKCSAVLDAMKQDGSIREVENENNEGAK